MNTLGVAYSLIGDSDKAIEAFNKGIKVSNCALCNHNKGVEIFKKGNRDDEALEIWQAIVSNESRKTMEMDFYQKENFCRTLESIAALHLKKDKHVDASKVLREAIKIAEELVDTAEPWTLCPANARLAKTLTLQAQLLSATGQFITSEGLFGSAIDRYKMIHKSKTIYAYDMANAIGYFGEMLMKQERRITAGKDKVSEMQKILMEIMKKGENGKEPLIPHSMINIPGWGPNPVLIR